MWMCGVWTSASSDDDSPLFRRSFSPHTLSSNDLSLLSSVHAGYYVDLNSDCLSG